MSFVAPIVVPVVLRELFPDWLPQSGTHRRWFVFEEFTLKAYESEASNEALLELNSAGLKVSTLNDDTIVVEAATTSFMLRASHAEERATWLAAIRECAEHGDSFPRRSHPPKQIAGQAGRRSRAPGASGRARGGA